MKKVLHFFVIAGLLLCMSTISMAETEQVGLSFSNEEVQQIADRILRGESVTPEEKDAAYSLVEQMVAAQSNENPPSIDETGGPDAFGYVWRDNNNEPTGPTYNWIDIATTGLSTGLDGDDAISGVFPIGFTFPYYGVNYTSFKVCTNGWLTLDPTTTSASYTNVAIPNTAVPNTMIAPLWDDLQLDSTTGQYIKYRNIGTDTLVVTWNIRHHLGTATYMMQAILVANGTIVYQYSSSDPTQITYTIGIEDATGSTGLQVRDAPTTEYAVTGRAVRISLPCNIVTLNTPANNAIQMPLTTALSWTGGTCTDNYDVYFGTDQTLVTNLDPTVRTASAITVTTWDPPGDLLEGTTYYWRIVARDTSVVPPDVFSSQVFSFRTFSPGISGIRTIGGTNPDYPTIQAAIDAVNAAGCGTGVTFLIRGGVYNENPDSLVASAMSSPNSPIVFKPADTLGVTINVTCTATARQAYAFVNADNVIWDGSHPDLPGRNLIAVNATGTDGYYGFRFSNGSDGCKVKNIDITVGGTSSSYRPIYIYYLSSLQPAASCLNDTVQNCRITGGYYGMYIYGSSAITHSGLVIEGNEVVDFAYYGMYIYYTTNSKFIGNRIHMTVPAAGTVYGIYNPTTSNVNNLYDRNWVYDLSTSGTSTMYGMYMAGASTLVSNNMINIDPTSGGTIYGLYFSTGAQNAYNNTVRLGGSSTGSYNSYTFYISGATSDSVVNNIFINDRTSTNLTNYHVGAYFANTTPFAYSNHNIWANDSEDPTDSKYAIRYNSINYNTLADLLQAGVYNWDANSLGIYPNFVGVPDLHINPLANTPVESNGLPIANVPNDFDNQVRNATTPDIGCDEGNFVGGGDFFRPRISHLPLGRSDQTTARVAEASITDNVGLAVGNASPKLYYKRSVDPTYTMVSADSVQQDSLYYFTIAGFPLTTIVEYYLAAQDTSGNLATLPGGGSGINPPGSNPPATPYSYDLQMVINGTRTIGGTNPDYATFADAIADLNNQGTGTGITFLIRGGTYDGIPDSILAGANGAPNRPIIFRPADTLGVVINKTPTSANPAYGFSFVNVDNVIFDGSHPDAPGRNFITLNMLGTYGYYGFVFANGSDNCKVKNVNVVVQQSTSSNFRPFYTQYRSSGLPLVGCNYDTIENCSTTNGYYGMYLYWTSSSPLNNWHVANNDVYDFYYYGIYHAYLQNSLFMGNKIHRSAPATGTMYGIYGSTSANSNQYIGNRIYDAGSSGTSTCYGFYLASGTNLTVANNMVNLDANSGGAAYGIYKSSNANGKIYYNTIRIGGSTAGSYNSAAMYYSSASSTDSLANNIWINERSGGGTTQYQTALYVPSTTPFAFSDNNILTTVIEDPTDNHYAIRVGSTSSYNTLDDARTGGWTTFDANSLGIPPAFIGMQDLHINPTAPTPVESAGRPIWNVLADIDNQTRNVTTPDIGCDEGEFLTGNDLIRPRITHEPLGTTETTAPRTAQAYISDNLGISTGNNAARLYHKRSNDTTWAFVNATTIQDSSYIFTIPGYPLGSIVQYYIACQDDAGNNTTHPFGGTGSNPPGTTPPEDPHTYFVATLLSGQKTIGGANPDFTTIDQAVNALSSIGVGEGGVTFNIRAGTYDENSSQFRAPLTPDRPALFRPDSGANVVINKTAAGGITAAFRFYATSNVTIDGSWPGDPNGRHITINNAGGNTHIIWIADSTDHNTVKNCVLNYGATTTSTNRVVQIGNPGTQPEVPVLANRIENNDIIGGYYAVYPYGNTTEVVDSAYIVGNDIRDFYYYGIYNGYATGTTIAYNHIFHQTASASSTLYGIYMTTNSNGFLIHGNRIDQMQGSATGTQYGMRLYGTGNVISSNMIALGGGNTGTCYGIYTSFSSGNPRILFNTVNLFGTTTSSSSYCLYHSTSTGADSLWGNIFQNTRTGGTTSYHVGIYVSSPAAVVFSDYNLFWAGEETTDNRYAARLGSTNLNTFTDLAASATWTPRDQFSYGEMPPFVSDTNLHIQPTISTVVEGGAPANGSVLFDVDANSRTANMYDVGADEGDFRRVSFGTIVGIVRDSIPTAPAMPGVTVRAGRYSTTTDVNGQYTLEVRSGTYDLQAEVSCYLPSIVAAVSIDSAQVDTQDIFMYHPEFRSDQTSIEFQLPPGETRSSTLIVSNLGNGPLAWRARPVALPPVMQVNPPSEPPVAEPLTTVAPDGSSYTVSPNPSPEEKAEYQAWVETHLPRQPIDPPAIDQHWGPDSFGYSADDIAEATFPSWFPYLDIRPFGTVIFSNVDIGLTRVSMGGFTFNYYGQEWDSLWVNTNGLVQFSQSATQYESGSIPSANSPGLVAAFWRDLDSDVRTYYDATSDVYYIQWDSRYHSGGTDSLHFQIQLHGSVDGIVMQYGFMQAAASATAGIQGGTGVGNTYISCFNNSAPAVGYSYYGLAFSMNGWMNWLMVSPLEGVIAPRGQSEIFVQVTADSALVAPATLNGSITFALQYHCPESFIIPVTSQVVGVSEIASALPFEYKLHQNFPNPFNPTTEIRFDLKLAGVTKLTVYDLLGRQVSSLVNENLPAGKHAVRFDATRIAAGVYFYRIQSGSFVETRKMVLVK